MVFGDCSKQAGLPGVLLRKLHQEQKLGPTFGFRFGFLEIPCRTSRELPDSGFVGDADGKEFQEPVPGVGSCLPFPVPDMSGPSADREEQSLEEIRPLF